ncbi:uncharacterized protein SCDLUD_000003 [Saccharomycodes ludwigii]|uniref:uncharacterized protein n=1 Tax=Saccharomycodes ludwigii TaxID=36035 RepID=UPI001E8C6F55|nr:hypothetical protein SCDLUD_000003 [Saccharomycodes ludwigii]KAH3902426.1 hypothetical protein SCDLUD_000003 [Saccharomycodes ludwigii]
MSHPYNSNNNNNSDQVSSEHGTHTGGNSVMLSKDDVLDKFNNLILSFDNKGMDKSNFVPGMKMFIFRMKRDGLGCLLENDAESVLGPETLKMAGEFFLYFKKFFPEGFDSSDGLQILIDIDSGNHDKTNVSEIKDITREWSNLYYDGSVSAATYINNVRNLIAKTKKHHCEMNEYEMKRRIIASMKKGYHKVKDIILLLNRGKLDVDFEDIYEVISNFYDEEEKEITMACRFDKDPFARQVYRNKENYDNKNGTYNKGSNEGSVKNVNSNKPAVCYNCQQEGHIRPDCPELKEKEKEKENEEKVKEVKLVNERENTAPSSTLRLRLVKKVLKTDQYEIKDVMYDTGAETTIVPNEWLHDPKQNFEHFCEDFNGNKINVPYVGVLILKSRGKEFKLEALGTVDTKQMVIGRSSLKNAGLVVNELDNCIYDINTKDVVGQVVEKDDSIYIPGLYIVYPEKLNVLNVSNKKLIDLYHIHVLCGHINVKDLQRSIKIGSIVGVKYDDINWTGIDDFKCDSCMKGKSTYKKHYIGSRASHQDHYDAGEYFHSDLFGPVPDINPRYPNSFITFIDEKSKFRFVYPLRSKSAEAIMNVLQEFIPYVEKNLGKTVKVIHSDQGNEYRNEDVRSYLQEFGIRQIFTTKGDSKANGVAERLNYTLLNDARTLMLNDNIPRSLWFFAVSYSCHVRNGIIAASNAHGLSPRQLLGVDKLDIAKLLPFGTHVILHSKEDDKLSARGIDGYILSPSTSSYGYKVWAKSLRRVIDSSSFKIAYDSFTDYQSRETAIDGFIEDLANNDESLENNEVIPELESENDDQIEEELSEKEYVPIINERDNNDEVTANETINPIPTVNDSVEKIDDSQCDENSEPEIIIDVGNNTENEENVNSDNKFGTDVVSGTEEESSTDSESEFSVEDVNDSEYQEDTNPDNETSVDDAKDPEYENSDSNSEGIVLSDKWSATKRDREDDSDISDDQMGHDTDEESAKVNINTWEINDDGKIRKMTEEEVIKYISDHPNKFNKRKRVMLRQVVAIRAVKSVKVTPDVKHSTGDTLYLHEIYGLTNKEIKNKYISAYRKELKNLEDSGTYDKNATITVDAVDKKQIVPLLILFNVKRSGEYKCRIVARGDEQDESTFNRDLSSSNLSHDGLMLILNMAFVNKLKIYQLDIKAAYLNAKLDEDIYVVTPSIYRKKNTVLKLKKSLYGLKQSGHLWKYENIINGELKLVSDASHSNAEDYKSQYGYLIYWNNLIVGAKTGVTTISCISSTEAEIFSMVKGIVTIKNWLTGTRRINKKEKIIVKCDNKSAILLCSSYNVSKFRDKFHGIRAYRMRQEKEKLKFRFVFVESKNNESDVLTKFNPDKKNIEKFMELFDR